MRTIWTVLFCLTLAVTSWAATPQDRFNAQINKAVPAFNAFGDVGKLSKYICSCNDPANGGYQGTGVLELFNGTVLCTVYTFNATGNIVLAAGCYPWLPVAR